MRVRPHRAGGPRAEAFGRQLWVGLVREFRDTGRELAAGRPLDDHRRVVLGGMVKRARGAGFPALGQSADCARQALVAACDGFLAAAPERRSVLAPLVVAACDCVETLLVEVASAHADRTWRRQFPEE